MKKLIMNQEIYKSFKIQNFLNQRVTLILFNLETFKKINQIIQFKKSIKI